MNYLSSNRTGRRLSLRSHSAVSTKSLEHHRGFIWLMNMEQVNHISNFRSIAHIWIQNIQLRLHLSWISSVQPFKFWLKLEYWSTLCGFIGGPDVQGVFFVVSLQTKAKPSGIRGPDVIRGESCSDVSCVKMVKPSEYCSLLTKGSYLSLSPNFMTIGSDFGSETPINWTKMSTHDDG